MEGGVDRPDHSHRVGAGVAPRQRRLRVEVHDSARVDLEVGRGRPADAIIGLDFGVKCDARPGVEAPQLDAESLIDQGCWVGRGDPG